MKNLMLTAYRYRIKGCLPPFLANQDLSPLFNRHPLMTSLPEPRPRGFYRVGPNKQI